MNPQIAMGLFALYVVVVSLVRLSASREFPRLTSMKKVWGRSCGMLLHFLSNVALPLVIGIVFVSRGVVGGGAERHIFKEDLSSWRSSIGILTTPVSHPRPEAPFEPAQTLPHMDDHANLPILPP